MVEKQLNAYLRGFEYAGIMVGDYCGSRYIVAKEECWNAWFVMFEIKGCFSKSYLRDLLKLIVMVVADYLQLL